MVDLDPEKEKMISPKILLVQWGTRGAGPKLLHYLAENLEKVGAEVLISISDVSEISETLNKQYEGQICEIKIGSKLGLLSLRRYLAARKTFLNFVKFHSPDITVFVMAHPWDLNYRNIGKTISIIHDAHRHPGDSFWPSTRAIHRRIQKADILIALSTEVLGEISNVGRISELSTHPIFEFSKISQNLLKDNDVIVIGRQRKYKGTELLTDIWPLVLDKLPDTKLIIAGEGKLNSKLSTLGNTTIINRWLDEYEIDELLTRTKCALFPYIEASQSGVLPAAASKGAKIVVTPVGGLIEQAHTYGGLVCESISPDDIAHEVIKALTSQEPATKSRGSAEVTKSHDLVTLIVNIALRERSKFE